MNKIKTQDNFVLLCTVYKGDNFGSSLQAFALKQYIKEKFDYDCIVIENLETGIALTLQKLNRKFLNFFKSFCSPRLFVNTWSTYLGKNRNALKYPDGILQKFSEFTQSQIAPVYLGKKDLKELARSRSCKRVITGSDQVWNPTGTMLSYLNFLCFSPRHKNVSYAASIGVDIVPYYNYFSFKHKIKKIKFISVREDEAKALLKEQFNIEASCCIDPVLLVGSEFWKKKLNKNIQDTDFIFCYFLNRPSQEALKTMQEHINLGKRIYIVSRSFVLEPNENIKILDNVGPFDFLSFINNSEIVLTDSFHGMAFSVLFSKEFLVFERDYGKSVPQTSRITSLLRNLNIDGRYIAQDSQVTMHEVINYKSVHEKIQRLRDKSADFLQEVMKDA